MQNNFSLQLRERKRWAPTKNKILIGTSYNISVLWEIFIFLHFRLLVLIPSQLTGRRHRIQTKKNLKYIYNHLFVWQHWKLLLNINSRHDQSAMYQIGILSRKGELTTNVIEHPRSQNEIDPSLTHSDGVELR